MENQRKINRIELKKYELHDLNSMKGLLTNDKIKQTYMIPDFESEQALDNFFAKLMEWSHSQQHYERGIYYQKQLIGFVNDVEIDGKSMELGYVIHPDYHNQGFATEALKLAIQELFLLGFEEVRAGAFEDNIASFQVMRKCGMVQIDQEDEIQYRGKQYRCLYYGITKTLTSTCLDVN